MSSEVRRKLLTEYAVALVAERESWERLCAPDVSEAQRCRVLGQWKQTSASLKHLVRRLRDADPAPVFDLQETAAGPSSDALLLLEASFHREQGLPMEAPSPAAPPLRLPFDGRWLAGSLRLVTLWCARAGSTLPRLGSP